MSKTLVICPIGLGNFVMTTPTLRLLSRTFGKGNLHLLALKSGMVEMAEAAGYFSRVFYWDPDRSPWQTGTSVLRSLRRVGYENLLSLFPSPNWKGSLFASFVGAKRQVGFSYPSQRAFSWGNVERLDLETFAHDTDQNLRLAERVTGRKLADPVRLEFAIPQEHRREADLERGHYYVCHAGSSPDRGMIHKRLPAHSFARLIEQLHDRFKFKAVLVGGSEEEGLRAEIRSRTPAEALLDVPSRSLGELGCIVKHARFYLGNDSGVMHISEALEKRCIGLFGPTDERRNGPYRYWERVGKFPRHLILRQADLDCSPCWTIHTVGENPPCQFGDYRCLTEWDVDSIWQAVSKFVASIESTSA